MSGLASRIINLSTGAKKFGTKQVNFTALKHVYTLVQCTPDLSGYDCTRCLRLAMKKLPSGNKRGRVLFPSCNAMFEVYPFYLTGNTSTPLPMPVPPPPTPKEASVDHVSLDTEGIESSEEVRQLDNRDLMAAIEDLQYSQPLCRKSSSPYAKGQIPLKPHREVKDLKERPKIQILFHLGTKIHLSTRGHLCSPRDPRYPLT
nr:cysteine-rich receptor-like protein kinase 10 [Quercus suber]